MNGEGAVDLSAENIVSNVKSIISSISVTHSNLQLSISVSRHRISGLSQGEDKYAKQILKAFFYSFS